MPQNVTQKLISTHKVEGEMQPGSEIGLKIDQTLCQDATGTMVMLECEAMGLNHSKAEVSVQYIDHNLLQTDFKNADDHLFLVKNLVYIIAALGMALVTLYTWNVSENQEKPYSVRIVIPAPLVLWVCWQLVQGA